MLKTKNPIHIISSTFKVVRSSIYVPEFYRNNLVYRRLNWTSMYGTSLDGIRICLKKLK
jgi:hypothetical protein